MALPSKNTQLNEIANFDIFRNGGKGSGNFGHSGRPGEVGGSAGSGGGDSSTSKAGEDANEKYAKGSSEISKSIKKLSDDDYVYDSGASVWDKSEIKQTFERLQREAKSLEDYVRVRDKKDWNKEDLQQEFGLIRYYTDTLVPYLESRASVGKIYKRHLKEMKKIADIAKEAEGDYYEKKNK